jgi:putative transcriptional regulator
MRLKREGINLTGSLLVAMPTLRDPNFRRTILFMTHHDPEQGGIGFILNRPKGICFGDLARDPVVDRGIPVYEGGPVGSEGLVVARLQWMEAEASFQSLAEDELGDHHGPAHEELRAFTGYAGWSSGQLEAEISEGSWVIRPPVPDLLMPVSTSEEGVSRWVKLMKGLGPREHLMALAPDHPELN